MGEISAVLFDLDGTLLNTIFDLTAAINHTMSELNFPSRAQTEVQSFVGNGIVKLIERALPDGYAEQSTVKRAYALFTEFYRENCAQKTTPYPGIVDLLTALKAKGIPMSVVSNKDEDISRRLCDRFFPGIFQNVRGGRSDYPKKPDPAGVQFCLKSMGVSAADALYVGDSDVDFFTAKNAGTACALVGWGFRPRESLARLSPDFLADSPQALQKWIFEQA